MDDATEDAFAAVATQPLLGEPQDLSVLIEEYRENPPFIPKLQALQQTYQSIRRSRGDGNCFYRSFIVALLQGFVDGGVMLPTGSPPANPLQAKYEEVLAYVDASKDRLLAIGYPEFTVPDFWEELMGHLKAVPSYSAADVFALFNDGMASNYVICYLRCLTSLEILTNDTYAVFVDAMHPGMTPKRFCETEVDPMAREADHLQISALTSGFRVKTTVAYLDASPSAVPTLHTFPDGDDGDVTDSLVHLLYRPGHYDIVQPRVGK